MNAANDIRYTVGQVADLFQVTVRTLYHWEQAGLLQPAELPGLITGCIPKQIANVFSTF